MLQLSRMELAETLNQELEENPVLEMSAEEPQEQEENSLDEKAVETEPETESGSDDNQSQDLELAPGASEPAAEIEGDFAPAKEEEKAREDIDWETYLGEYSSAPAPNMREIPEEYNYENFVAEKATLSEHLLWQWRMEVKTDQEDAIGNQIIGNLDSTGYLQASCEEIAELENCRFEDVEPVLTRIQDLDPAGVGARGLGECLRIQLAYLGLKDSLATRIVEGHLAEVEKRNYQKIARELKVTKEKVYEAMEIILNLEPRPGRAFTTEQPQYIEPDVYIYKMADKYIIELNDDGMPRLRVNQYYRDVLTNQQVVPAQTKEYIQGKLRSAVWLIRSIHQRQRTIYKVTESIVKYQQDFLDKGVSWLKPLVLRDIAEDVEMHESTISRVTTNKYAHTPQGIFELKYFFNSSISRFDGESMASESVKERIRDIIGAENARKPLSDQRIVEILTGSNIDIARRTVAKYREMLGILSSSKRKKHF